MAETSNTKLDRMREDARKIFEASLEPVNPYEAVRRFVRIEDNLLLLGTDENSQKALDLKQYRHIYLVGGGKATAPMARAMEDILGDRIDTGIIVVKYGFTEKALFYKNH